MHVPASRSRCGNPSDLCQPGLVVDRNQDTTWDVWPVKAAVRGTMTAWMICETGERESLFTAHEINAAGPKKSTQLHTKRSLVTHASVTTMLRDDWLRRN